MDADQGYVCECPEGFMGLDCRESACGRGWGLLWGVHAGRQTGVHANTQDGMCESGGAAHSSLYGKSPEAGHRQERPRPPAPPLEAPPSLSPWQEPPRTTVSVTTVADAWEPTPPSASAPQASLGFSANSVGSQGRGGPGKEGLSCPAPEHPPTRV